jgi:hypothetical protein
MGVSAGVCSRCGALAVGGNDQRQLVAQCEGQQAEGSDFAGSVHPDFVFAHGQHGDDVIELRGRRDVGIELAAGVDEHRRGMQAFGFEQGGEQRVLIFAVAVLIVQDVCGGVGLVAAETERQADVAEILRDEVVESLDLIQVGVEAFGEFGGFGADFRRGRAPVFFQVRIPAADLFPTDEGG